MDSGLRLDWSAPRVSVYFRTCGSWYLLILTSFTPVQWSEAKILAAWSSCLHRCSFLFWRFFASNWSQILQGYELQGYCTLLQASRNSGLWININVFDGLWHTWRCCSRFLLNPGLLGDVAFWTAFVRCSSRFRDFAYLSFQTKRGVRYFLPPYCRQLRLFLPWEVAVTVVESATLVELFAGTVFGFAVLIYQLLVWN